MQRFFKPLRALGLGLLLGAAPLAAAHGEKITRTRTRRCFPGWKVAPAKPYWLSTAPCARATNRR
ncbi:hypothetical protein [Microbulbifer taiwanensis]|uniref:hypothetical protein n=1 Tax=Microbulbifer taiwanensis TaxID=986746 RepID=UPI00361C6757